MNFRLFCIFIIHTFVENLNAKIPDLRYTKTTCVAGYNSWSNGVNDLLYPDITASPYLKNKNCWVYQNYIQFEQPYLSYEFIVFLAIFIFSIVYLFR